MRLRAATAAVVMACTAVTGMSVTASASAHGRHGDHAFRQVNLVSDLTTMGPGVLVDPAVKNPWGIALGPTSPLWVNNQFNPASDCGSPDCLPAPADLLTKITLYRGATSSHDPIQKVPLEVTASSPFGMVFNPTSSFKVTQNGVTAPARFLFNEVVLGAQGPVAEVTGWSNATTPPPTTTVATNATKPGALQFGLALVPGREDGHGGSHGDGKHGPLLLAADGVNGVIDVYDGNFNPVAMPHAFVDPHAAAEGLAPYNVTFLKGRVYVTYATQGVEGGAVSVFKRDGRFIKRLVTGAPLNGPWGMTIAPEHWGHFGGALLVGNVDSGMINVFNRRTGRLLGTLRDEAGKPLVNPGLWGLEFGNGTIGTPRTLLFAAGIGEEVGGFGEHVYEHGLVGLIEPVDDDD